MLLGLRRAVEEDHPVMHGYSGRLEPTGRFQDALQALLNLRIAGFGNDLNGLWRHGWGDIARMGWSQTGKQQNKDARAAQPTSKVNTVAFWDAGGVESCLLLLLVIDTHWPCFVHL